MAIVYCLLAVAGFVGLWFFNSRVICDKLVEPVRKYPYTKFEKCLYIFLIILGIFIAGVQVGIKHGRELQIQEIYEYSFTN